MFGTRSMEEVYKDRIAGNKEYILVRKGRLIERLAVVLKVSVYTIDILIEGIINEDIFKMNYAAKALYSNIDVLGIDSSKYIKKVLKRSFNLDEKVIDVIVDTLDEIRIGCTFRDAKYTFTNGICKLYHLDLKDIQDLDSFVGEIRRITDKIINTNLDRNEIKYDINKRIDNIKPDKMIIAEDVNRAYLKLRKKLGL